MAHSEAIVDAAGETFTRFVVVRELGARKVKTTLARGSAPEGVERLVLERYSPSLGLSPLQLDGVASVARRLVSLRHPNVCLVRDVAMDGDDVLVASEYAEGVTFEELRRLATAKGPIPLEIGLRVVVDLLSGLSALHTQQGEMLLAHGEVSASNVLVGQDGVTKLLRPYRGVVASAVVEAESFGYIAPEVLKGSPADVASDVFSAGVFLWEVLSRRKLFGKTTREAMAGRTLKIPKPIPPADATWAAALSNVAERALALDPAQRYGTAAEMAAALRLIVRSRLAMPPKVADLVERVAGEALAARRASDPESDAPPVSVRGPNASRPSIPPHAVKVLDAIRPSARPGPTASAFVHEAPTVPRAPAVPSFGAPSTELEEESPISLGNLLEEDLMPASADIQGKPAAPQAKPASPPAASSSELTPPMPRPSTRPMAPALDLTPVVPVAGPVLATPGSAMMPAKATSEPAHAMSVVPAEVVTVTSGHAKPEAPEEQTDEAPPRRKKPLVPILIGVGAVCLVVIAIAGFRALSAPQGPPPVASVVTTSAPSTTTTAAAATTTATVDTAPSSAPTATESAAPSAEPSAVAPAASGSGKKTAKPRPTYDPEGI